MIFPLYKVPDFRKVGLNIVIMIGLELNTINFNMINDRLIEISKIYSKNILKLLSVLLNNDKKLRLSIELVLE